MKFLRDFFFGAIGTVLLGMVLYQNTVIVSQRNLIRQMVTNPFCLMPKEAVR